MSVSAVLYPRWPPLLKIEISSNVQNCSILSQNVPKFEMYKHNDELFKIYYWNFYELWTFDRLRGHKTFFFASLFWKGVKISHIWKLYRIFHSILIIFVVVEWIVSSMVCWRISSIFYGIFSSPGQRQCELLPSLDVRRLKPLSQMNWNLVGSIYGKSSLKIAHFVPIY